jgi:hypothetical protein
MTPALCVAFEGLANVVSSIKVLLERALARVFERRS